MKVGHAGGHGDGCNFIPAPWRNLKPEYSRYSEGTENRLTATAICDAYPQVFNARPEKSNPDWKTRAKRMKAAGCDVAIEDHTNWSMHDMNTPNRGTFVVISSLFYERPGEPRIDEAQRLKKVAYAVDMATRWFKPMADAMGLRFEVRQKKGGGRWDYYSFIQECRNRYIEFPFIVEHGYHMDFADNVAKNRELVVKRWGEILGASAEHPPLDTQTWFTTTLLCFTLYSVAKKFGVRWETIRLADGSIPNKGAMRPGMRLLIK